MARVITGHFSKEWLENARKRFYEEQIATALQDEKISRREAMMLRCHYGITPSGGANAFYITNAVAQGMLGSTGLTEAIDAGTAAVIQWYSGSVPADADAANAGTLLGTLTCNATAFSGVSDDTPGALATFAAITNDSSADDTGTASFFRISTQSGGTVIAQGTIGTSSADLVVNTTAVTAGSALAISAATILLPEGP